MTTVAGVELFFCMCGPLERKCPHCEGIFQEAAHKGTSGIQGSTLILSNMRPINCDWIKCIFCGSITWPKDFVKRFAKEIKAERKG